MLDGQVDVGDHLVQGCHGLDQLIVPVRGMAVEQPDPAQPGHLLQRGEHVMQADGTAKVQAIAGAVLGHDHHLLHAVGRQQFRLGPDLRQRAAAARSLDEGDGAVAAAVVAPFRDAQIGIVARCQAVASRAGVGGHAEIGGDSGRSDAGIEIKEKAVHLRQQFLEFGAVALGQAAADQQLEAGPLLLQRRQLQNRFNRLLFGAGDEGAGIDQGDIGDFRLFHQLHAAGEAAEDGLEIDAVLWAAKAYIVQFHAKRASTKVWGSNLCRSSIFSPRPT